MNILFFLTPKAVCAYLYSDYSVRQALEKMEGYATLPILDREGRYVGSLTEGDLLWAVKNICGMDLKRTEGTGIMEIAHRKDYAPVSVNTEMKDIIAKAVDQNFVPVVDDKDSFIGLVTRRAILQHYLKDNAGQR
ncbi:MAG: CBS domain-containing protein [Oscillospiraceae bacterium]|nr:CBS domain-containing protein [Oscillospiraceae bacterium]